MSYLPQFRKQGKARFFYFAGILLVVLIAGSFVFGLLDAPRAILVSAVSPIWDAENNFLLKIKVWSGYFKSKKALSEENMKLKNNLLRLSAIELENRALVDENDALKEEVGRGGGRQQGVLGIILARPNRTPYDTFIIDVGANYGVKRGDRVITLGNIIIGEIIEAYESESRAVLYSSPERETDVIIGPEYISAVAYGIGNGNYRIEIPREVGIEPNFIISVPSIENYILGSVSEVKSEPADALKRILFKIPVNFQQLRWVEIISR